MSCNEHKKDGDKAKDDDLDAIYIWLTIAIACAIAAWLINFDIGKHLLDDKTNRGQFGDVFGAVNSLFSGLAFIGVVYSVLLQRKELDAVREERDETREIFKDQQDNLRQQRIETTFFQMFSAFKEIVEGMDISSVSEYRPDPSKQGQKYLLTTSSKKGSDVFGEYIKIVEFFYHDAKRIRIKEIQDRNEDPVVAQLLIELEEKGQVWHLTRAFNHLFQYAGNDVGRYYRSLYTMMNFIETNIISERDKSFYFKLIRAQLSSDESTMLALNMRSYNSTTDFNHLISKYGMAKNRDRASPLLSILNNHIPHGAYGNTFVRECIAMGRHPTTYDYKLATDDLNVAIRDIYRGKVAF